MLPLEYAHQAQTSSIGNIGCAEPGRKMAGLRFSFYKVSV